MRIKRIPSKPSKPLRPKEPGLVTLALQGILGAIIWAFSTIVLFLIMVPIFFIFFESVNASFAAAGVSPIMAFLILFLIL
jgi:hypothetical protein